MRAGDYYRAVLDFRRARRRAAQEQLLARLHGKSAELLPYEQVRHMLKGKIGHQLGLREIPLDAIVGSLGRYSDFTRSFLPLQDEDQERWAMIQAKASDLDGLPPIEVYQIGEVYFVRDGNHRVSVARQLGATHIEAYVTEVQTRVSLSPEVQPDDLIVKSEASEFLELTDLDLIRPGANLDVTIPGQYPKLLEQIDVHRYYMGLEQRREIPYQEAAGDWYDRVYLPTAQVIREQNLLDGLPNRTETDLYVWLSEHRAALEEALGWEIQVEPAAAHLAEQFSHGTQRPISRATRVHLTRSLLDALTPDALEGGPEPGTWRRERLALHRDDCMFADILVPVSGQESGWQAVAQAMEIACRENARLLGLHVVRSAAEKESERVLAVRGEFARRCEALGVRGKLAVEVGRIARKICERSRWADLVVLSMVHPPAPQAVARLSSGFRTLIRRCSTPVLAVPGAFSPLSRPLLAYDGSPKAREALYVATYLTARAQVPLAVVTVPEDGRVTEAALAEAGEYLKAHGVQTSLVLKQGPVADAILKTAEQHGSDLILIGGYGHSPVVEAVLGSAVDQVLRTTRQPMLICR
jgi:nucleotide-binding universal stress UspA family protein